MMVENSCSAIWLLSLLIMCIFEQAFSSDDQHKANLGNVQLERMFWIISQIRVLAPTEKFHTVNEWAEMKGLGL